MWNTWFKKNKKLLVVCVISLVLFVVGFEIVSAQSSTKYNLLAPITQNYTTFDSAEGCAFGRYLGIVINIAMGIAAVLALLMIVIGGIEYMTSELISSKQAGKEKIINALLGILIILSAWLVLNTINPKILNLCLQLPEAKLTIEQQEIINNWSGSGKCQPITDTNNACHPSKLTGAFTGSSNANPPFNTIAAQASAICWLESRGIANMPVGKNPNQYMDKCADNKPFSFGLFQINASAHRYSIPACQNAFIIPPGHGNNQGNCLEKDPKSGYCMKWSCTTKEPGYTQCQNYLINPINNMNYASTLYKSKGWGPWTTYNSCKGNF